MAAALIPPNVVQMVSEETTLSAQLDHGDDPWYTTNSQMFGTGGESTMQPIKDWMQKEK